MLELAGPGWYIAGADSALKDVLGRIGVPKAREYRTHDIQRGHARDLQLSGVFQHICWYAVRTYYFIFTGAPLWEILAAGEWRSPAFLDYLDLHQLEQDAVVQVSLCLAWGYLCLCTE